MKSQLHHEPGHDPYANALGKRAKTDKLDAQVIAAFAAAIKPDIRPLPDEKSLAFSDLVNRRRQIVEMIVAEENRSHMALTPKAHKSIKRLLAAMRRELESLDGDLEDHIRKVPELRMREELMTSVPGVGPTIARTLLAEIPELGMLDRRQIAALAGLAPWTRQSGKWKGKSFIGGGRDCQEISAVVVADLFALWQATLPRISGKSKLAEAIRYAISRRAIFERFLTDGRIELDSNIVERAIRPQTIIRKNSLFAGSDSGGRTWATIATLLQTAKMNHVDPIAWLAQTLERIANRWPSSHIDALMPWNHAA